MTERINLDGLLARANVKTIGELIKTNNLGLENVDLIELTPEQLEIIMGQASLTGFYSNRESLDSNKVS
jgi:hypothetical protein